MQSATSERGGARCEAGRAPSRPCEEYFFDRVRPLIERALASGQQDRWPVVVLHLDFKSNEREHHRAVWDLLKQHRRG